MPNKRVGSLFSHKLIVDNLNKLVKPYFRCARLDIVTYSMIYSEPKKAYLRPSFIMLNTIISFILLPFIIQGQPIIAGNVEPLASRDFSLEKRYNDSFVNEVFKDNILLTIKYLTGDKINPKKINFEDVRKPFEYKLILEPGDTFAFHDDVLPEYDGKVARTTNAHFNAQDGFKSDGFLMGDGVCHLASLLYWVARDAGLETKARVNHNFANIPEVPKDYGVSIYAYPGRQYTDQMQNLYITNNKNREIAFEFKYDGENLKITVVEAV